MTDSSSKFRIFASTFFKPKRNTYKIINSTYQKRPKKFGELLKLSYICSNEK